jgi:hypothetical protein
MACGRREQYKRTYNGRYNKRELKVPCVRKITQGVATGDDVEHLIHVEKDPITLRCPVVVLMAPKEMLDLRESLFDWIEVGRVGREEFNADAKTISELEKLVTMVNLGIVEDEDAKRAWVCGALGNLQTMRDGNEG